MPFSATGPPEEEAPHNHLAVPFEIDGHGPRGAAKDLRRLLRRLYAPSVDLKDHVPHTEADTGLQVALDFQNKGSRLLTEGSFRTEPRSDGDQRHLLGRGDPGRQARRGCGQVA